MSRVILKEIISLKNQQNIFVIEDEEGVKLIITCWRDWNESRYIRKAVRNDIPDVLIDEKISLVFDMSSFFTKVW